jgi:hypothetical protein
VNVICEVAGKVWLVKRRIKMALLTEYHVLKSGVIQFSLGDSVSEGEITRISQRVKFNPPNDIVLDSKPINLPIISYNLATGDENRNVRWTVSIHTIQGSLQEQDTIVLNGGMRITRFNSLNPTHLHKDDNIIQFEAMLRKGQSFLDNVRISDVIMWFKRDRPKA